MIDHRATYSQLVGLALFVVLEFGHILLDALDIVLGRLLLQLGVLLIFHKVGDGLLDTLDLSLDLHRRTRLGIDKCKRPVAAYPRSIAAGELLLQ